MGESLHISKKYSLNIVYKWWVWKQLWYGGGNNE